MNWKSVNYLKKETLMTWVLLWQNFFLNIWIKSLKTLFQAQVKAISDRLTLQQQQQVSDNDRLKALQNIRGLKIQMSK
jgi:hypothetical protein